MRDRLGDLAPSRRRLVASILLVLVIAAPIGYSVSTFNHASAGGRFASSSGAVIYFQTDQQLGSSYPRRPNSESLNFSTQVGTINFSSPGSSEAQVTTYNGATWEANLSNIDVRTNNLTIAPSDMNETTIGDDITSVSLRPTGVEDGTIDVIYSTGTGTGTIVVRTNATPGEQYGLVDVDDDEGLDVATADSNGKLAFTSVEQGTHTAAIQTLGSLFIRNESSPHGLLTNANAELMFFENVEDDPQIVVRETSSGELELTGIDTTAEFIVDIRAPGYYNRSILIKDLAAQETVFLIAKNRSLDAGLETVNQTLRISDLTGDFIAGEDVDLRIQKAINRSIYDPNADGYEWTTITGDKLGADEELEVTLEKGARYRIVIDNNEGDTRILSNYQPIEDGTKELTITEDDQIVVETLGATVRFEPGIGVLPAQNGVPVNATIRTANGSFSSYEFKGEVIDSSGSSTVLFQVSGSLRDGEKLNQTIDLSNNESETVVLTVNWTRSDGVSGSATTSYIVHEAFGSQHSILNLSLNLTEKLPSQSQDTFTAFLVLLLAVFGTAAVASQVRMGPELAGLVALAFFVLGGLLNLLSWDIVFALGATWFIVVAILRGL